MINFKCKNCGGEVIIDTVGDLVCPYCFSKQTLKDSDFNDYREFRKKLLVYAHQTALGAEYSGANDAYEKIWKNAETICLKQADGTDITISFIYRASVDGVDMYCAKTSAVYVFPKERRNLAEAALAACSRITYPQADMKNPGKSVPILIGRYELADGGVLMAYDKPKDVLPLGLFGNMKDVHVEWIISRMENICCLLEFNDAVHGGLCPDNLFINPRLHEAILLGGWWRMRSKEEAACSDLEDIRRIGKMLLGTHADEAADGLREFLDSEPMDSAFEDFEAWDWIIENRLGGRHFSKFDLKDY